MTGSAIPNITQELNIVFHAIFRKAQQNRIHYRVTAHFGLLRRQKRRFQFGNIFHDLCILSGIRKYYTPEEMVGKKVMVLVNLKPATLAGVVSEGMILCAEDADGNLSIMTPEKEMPAGAEIC